MHREDEQPRLNNPEAGDGPALRLPEALPAQCATIRISNHVTPPPTAAALTCTCCPSQSPAHSATRSYRSEGRSDGVVLARRKGSHRAARSNGSQSGIAVAAEGCWPGRILS